MRTLTIILGSALIVSAFAGRANAQVTLPAGNSIFLNAFGDGVQIYNSAPDGAGGFQWNFIAPQANLYTDAAETTLLGTHFAGPTWQYSADSSSVVGLRIASGPSPNPNSIPELELIAQSHGGTGLFNSVSYILRLNTVGGIAPAVAPTALNQTANVHYTATYSFAKATPEPGALAILGCMAVSGTAFLLQRRSRR